MTSVTPLGSRLMWGWNVSTGALGSQQADRKHWGPGQEARERPQCRQDLSVGKSPRFGTTIASRVSSTSFLVLKAEIISSLPLTQKNEWVDASWLLWSVRCSTVLHLWEQSAFHLISTTTLVIDYHQLFPFYRGGNWGLVMSFAPNLIALSRYSWDLNPGSWTLIVILLTILIRIWRICSLIMIIFLLLW